MNTRTMHETSSAVQHHLIVSIVQLALGMTLKIRVRGRTRPWSKAEGRAKSPVRRRAIP
jgi:uncharacterized membrane protein